MHVPQTSKPKALVDNKKINETEMLALINKVDRYCVVCKVL